MRKTSLPAKCTIDVSHFYFKAKEYIYVYGRFVDINKELWGVISTVIISNIQLVSLAHSLEIVESQPVKGSGRVSNAAFIWFWEKVVYSPVHSS